MGHDKEKRKRDDLESTLPNVDPSDNWDGCWSVIWGFLEILIAFLRFQ